MSDSDRWSDGENSDFRPRSAPRKVSNQKKGEEESASLSPSRSASSSSSTATIDKRAKKSRSQSTGSNLSGAPPPRNPDTKGGQGSDDVLEVSADTSRLSSSSAQSAAAEGPPETPERWKEERRSPSIDKQLYELPSLERQAIAMPGSFSGAEREKEINSHLEEVHKLVNYLGTGSENRLEQRQALRSRQLMYERQQIAAAARIEHILNIMSDEHFQESHNMALKMNSEQITENLEEVLRFKDIFPELEIQQQTHNSQINDLIADFKKLNEEQNQFLKDNKKFYDSMDQQLNELKNNADKHKNSLIQENTNLDNKRKQLNTELENQQKQTKKLEEDVQKQEQNYNNAFKNHTEQLITEQNKKHALQKRLDTFNQNALIASRALQADLIIEYDNHSLNTCIYNQKKYNEIIQKYKSQKEEMDEIEKRQQ